jgi:D-serine deaminase-like pyridoxal phosphate-dependent protein
LSFGRSTSDPLRSTQSKPAKRAGGTHADPLDTPAVTILLDRVEANIRRVQSQLDAYGVANRRHIKTHKIPAIAKQQIEAGAVGITCQKLGEVEAFIDAGAAEDILVTYNIIGEAKTERLIALSKRIRRLAVVLDNEVVARGFRMAARRHGDSAFPGRVRYRLRPQRRANAGGSAWTWRGAPWPCRTWSSKA